MLRRTGIVALTLPFCIAGCGGGGASPSGIPIATRARTSTPPPTSTATPAPRITRVDLPVTDMVYDPVSDTIYGSVESIGAMAETITSINPRTGTIGGSIFVGDHPGVLGLSGDGQFLYVALDQSAMIGRVNLAAQTPDLVFPVGTDNFLGTLYASQIEVLPGNAHAVAVSMRYDPLTSPPFAGVAIFDDGVPRSKVVPSYQPANTIAFADSASVLYGFDSEDTGAYVLAMSIDDDGVSVDGQRSVFHDGPFPAFMSDMKFDDGLLYGTSGAAYDPVEMTIKGTFDFATNCLWPACGCVVPDSRTGRVFVLTSDTVGDDVIKVFDQRTFLQIGTFAVPGIRFDDTFTDVCLRWGENGFAFEATEYLAGGARADYVVLVELP